MIFLGHWGIWMQPRWNLLGKVKDALRVGWCSACQESLCFLRKGGSWQPYSDFRARAFCLCRWCFICNTVDPWAAVFLLVGITILLETVTSNRPHSFREVTHSVESLVFHAPDSRLGLLDALRGGGC